MVAAASPIRLEECPESALLQSYLLGRLPDDEFESVDSHVSLCDSCSVAIQHSPPGLDDLTSQLSRIPSETDFGDYELILRLGRGGMGHVYRARHHVLGQDFALKVIHPDLQNDPHFAARFEREIQSLGKVNSPHVVQPMHAGEWQGKSFVVMELIDGCDLGTLVRQQGVLSSADAAEVIAQMASGLDAIHGLDLVHRDLHPGNVLLNRHGQIKIGDLGLITATDQFDDPIGLTDARDRLGSEAFMAPEQRSRPDAVTPAADLFSLGCVWHYLLTGRSLSRQPLTHQVTRLEECLKSIPRSCRPLMARLLSNEPDRRPSCAMEVVETLKPMRRKARLAELFREPPAHSPERSRYIFAAGVAVLTVVLGVIGFFSQATGEAAPTVSPYHELASNVIQIPYERGGPMVRRFHFEACPGRHTLELVDSQGGMLSKGLLSTWWYLDNVDVDESTRLAISERSPRPMVTFELIPGTHKVSAMSIRADPPVELGGQESRLIDHAGIVFYIYPDLSVSGIEASSDNLRPGDQFTVSANLTNRGTVDANAGVLRVFLNPGVPSYLSGECAELSYSPLAAGATEPVRAQVSVPAGFPAGPAFVSVFADATDTTSERDEQKIDTWRAGKANGFYFIPKADPKGPPTENNRSAIEIKIQSKD